MEKRDFIERSGATFMLTCISWLAVLFWMAIIFFLSHEPSSASSELSSGIADKFIKFMEMIAPDFAINMDAFHHMVRKSAHFLAYFVLGVLVFQAVKRSGVVGCRRMIMTLGLCVLYAISDEVHQLFIPGRSGEVRDVLIDSAGASVGVAVMLVIVGLKKREWVR